MLQTCKQCNIEKPLFEYSYHDKNRIKRKCKKCVSQSSNDWYHSNRDTQIEKRKKVYEKTKHLTAEARKKWNRENPEKRRAISKKSFIKNKTERLKKNKRRKNIKRNISIKKIANSQNGLCYYCWSRPVVFCYDHIIPINKSGTDTIGNLVAVCKSCNSKKKDMLVIKFKLHSKQMGYKLRL